MTARRTQGQQELPLFLRWPRAKAYRRSEAEVKAVVRFRDGYRCRECGMTAKDHYRQFHRALEVHRLVPGSRYTVRGCITLCKKCHRNKPKSASGSGCRRANSSVDLRADPSWVARVERQAERFRVNLSAYIREAVTRRLEEDEESDRSLSAD